MRKNDKNMAGISKVQTLAIIVVVSIIAIIGLSIYGAGNNPAAPGSDSYIDIPKWDVRLNIAGAENVRFDQTTIGADSQAVFFMLKDDNSGQPECESLGVSLVRSAERPDVPSETYKLINDNYYAAASAPTDCPDAEANNRREAFIKAFNEQNYTLESIQ